MLKAEMPDKRRFRSNGTAYAVLFERKPLWDHAALISTTCRPFWPSAMRIMTF